MNGLPLPPRWVRRAVLAPALVAATAVLLAATPIIVLVLAFGIRFLPGRWRPLRLFWFLLVYLLRETIGIVALAFLWVASGFGRRLATERFRRAHVALIGWYLRGLVGSASRVLHLRLVTEAVPDDLAVPAPVRRGTDPRTARRNAEPPRPVIVFSRHAGAGDSFILAHLLVNTYRRRPRVVLKDLLQLDPCIDVVLNRIPSAFITPRRAADSAAPAAAPAVTGERAAERRARQGNADVLDSITVLAEDIEDDGALILFPEGGNFTERRRTRAIAQLERAGLDDAVARAHELTYVLPPRPGGAFAAIEAAPHADVLFVAHTGLEQLSGAGDLWRGLPMDREVRLTWWRVRREDIPEDLAERTVWLFEWWEVIDTWIEERRDPDRPATPLVVDDLHAVEPTPGDMEAHR